MEILQLEKDQDEIDSAIVLLFKRRIKVVKKIASIQKNLGINLSDKTRELEILSRVSEMAGSDLAGDAQALYKQILLLSYPYLQSV